MATVEENIEAALFTRVTSLSLTPARQVAYPNVPFSPPAAGYLEVLHFPNRPQRVFLRGSDPHFRQGILQLTVVSPLNEGATPATKAAGEIAAHFPADLALYSEGVKVKVQAAPRTWPAEKTDTSWTVRVDVAYECFG
ncbi:MAG: hypothetical protein FD144_2670 [Rhodospirillaceae bacterium]|nr:MAG: hypothetical protein FD144_2670 [Rhodospirillaceae bacterium]